MIPKPPISEAQAEGMGATKGTNTSHVAAAICLPPKNRGHELMHHVFAFLFLHIFLFEGFGPNGYEFSWELTSKWLDMNA